MYFFITVSYSTQLKQQMSIGNSSEFLCNFNISEYACSSVSFFNSSLNVVSSNRYISLVLIFFIDVTHVDVTVV